MFHFSSRYNASQHNEKELSPTPKGTDQLEDPIILVGWDGKDDPLNPANCSVARKLFMTILVSLIAMTVTAASAIDACGVEQYSEYYHVSEVVGSLATGTETSNSSGKSSV
jgi:hypothetical protein